MMASSSSHDNDNNNGNATPAPAPAATITVDDTLSQIQQRLTEQECAPFFVDLATLPASQLEHLRETGLLIADDDSLDVQLMRAKHLQYLSTIWVASPLHPSFVSLDSSRPWMLYWCWHARDLLLHKSNSNSSENNNNSNNDNSDNNNNNNDNNPSGDADAATEQQLLERRMVETLKSCFTPCPVQLPRAWVESDEGLRQLWRIQQQQQQQQEEQQQQQEETAAKDDSTKTSTPTADTGTAADTSDTITFRNAGGFGGGAAQMPHAATSYAAVLCLCVLSERCGAALQFLETVRPALYPWLVGLRSQQTAATATAGAFRMHHDGEMDVRATYCCVVMAKLLNLLQGSILEEHAADYVARCQTWEGGLAGEPGGEAHGGYTFCGVAALQILRQMDALLDADALLGWLARRQMQCEGGYSGRSNKLVDGCYSFWQGAAAALVSRHVANVAGNSIDAVKDDDDDDDDDPWLKSENYNNSEGGTPATVVTAALLDAARLERYILLCCQDVNGGLRDKPSKPRDFYHTCYCLSGLSIARHLGGPPHYGSSNSSAATRIARTHPCYNIRVEYVERILAHFAKEDEHQQDDDDKETTASPDANV